ncbi:uncharacterized protein FIBRA_00908 [Fibroporia radiculosa]|uniref:Xylanolytic transcriptional activator regulatory domain-containing protein n=1 Tax=Fibroporia radiculosa TaxID=599839 RepID=J4I871_9APHY|nr:uncharacterized protein FIBRA_00908 [Fibroporia radiculosa]CCL98901.1 predicted protein [Fibroporia radiculosa]
MANRSRSDAPGVPPSLARSADGSLVNKNVRFRARHASREVVPPYAPKAKSPTTGSLTTGKGNRLALADAEELHKKIDRLRSRSAALEDALRTLQASVCDEPHPLLAQEDGMQVSPSERSSASPAHASSAPREDEDFIDVFGTLTVGVRGESKFYGPTSRSEYLIHAPARGVPCTQIQFPHISAELVQEAIIDLDVPCNHAEVQNQVRDALPSLSRACRLCDIFMEYGQFIWYPLSRVELFDQILGSVYKFDYDRTCDLASMHAMAMMFMVFALGTLFDMESSPSAIEAHEYYILSRICLRCAPPIQDTTLTAVQTIIYMAQYLEMSDCEPARTGSHRAWLLVGLASQLGHSLGLHVSGSRWKLDDDASHKRGRVFWQLFLQDTWISFGFGRPPSMATSFIDCPMPKDPDERINEQGQKEWGFHHWTWQYTRLMHAVITSCFGAKTPPYSTVIDFDRKIRDFPVPHQLRSMCPQAQDPEPTIALFMQQFLTMACKEATLLNLHRAFFTQALLEQPQDLLRHKYGPSVMAIYRSAWRIIEGAKEVFKRAKAVAVRLGIIWSHSLAGGIVMGLLVTRAPTSPLASSSLQELDSLCDLFEQAASLSPLVANNLDFIRRVCRQGHATMSTPETPQPICVIDSELDRIGGKTHLISSAQEPPTSCARDLARQAVETSQVASVLPTVPPSTSSGSSPSVNLSPSPAVSMDFIHPTIMQDMRVFDGVGDPMGFAPFNFDLPSGIAGQMQDPSTADIFEELFGPQPFAHGQEAQTVQVPPGPPVLDATWQSFVEQLGF